MASRPIFIPTSNGPNLVREIEVSFQWNPGFAPIQKRKNISALHTAGRAIGYPRLLEISTKSDLALGRELSAFNLKYELIDGTQVPLECAYQGSKVFQKGGPYKDLLLANPREAKKDPRLRSSGNLVAFELESEFFPTEPKHAFYDWLYIRSVYRQRERLVELANFDGYTDIEFNPSKSINCQARSFATFLSLHLRGQLSMAMDSPSNFASCLTAPDKHNADGKQPSLFD